MAEYFAQRASASVIFTETTDISQQKLGWPYGTGLWSPEHVAGWGKVSEPVHAAGCKIISQLWHVGGVVHPSHLVASLPSLRLPMNCGNYACGIY